MRICTIKDCNYPVFGTDKNTGLGYCMKHQYKRTDKKRYKPKRSRIRQSNKKTGELSLFMEIYQQRPKESFISGISLEKYTGKLWFNLFAHVIPKNGDNELSFENTDLKNKYLRLNKDNIVLLTPYEHMLFDHGTEKQREDYKIISRKHGIIVDWNKLYELKKQLKTKIKNELQNY